MRNSAQHPQALWTRLVGFRLILVPGRYDAMCSTIAAAYEVSDPPVDRTEGADNLERDAPKSQISSHHVGSLG